MMQRQTNEGMSILEEKCAQRHQALDTMLTPSSISYLKQRNLHKFHVLGWDTARERCHKFNISDFWLSWGLLWLAPHPLLFSVNGPDLSRVASVIALTNLQQQRKYICHTHKVIELSNNQFWPYQIRAIPNLAFWLYYKTNWVKQIANPWWNTSSLELLCPFDFTKAWLFWFWDCF